MNKKKLYVLMALVIVLAILGTGTLAYFTTRAVVHNVITTGGVKIDLVETMLNDKGQEVDFEDQTGVMPGQEVSKIVRVENNDADAWIRVKVTVSCEGKAVPASVMTIDYNTTDWVPDTEDPSIYYYKAMVPAPKNGVAQKTTPLFTTVSFSGEGMGNSYMSKAFEVNVQAQAVQYANNGANVMEAAGWPDFD